MEVEDVGEAMLELGNAAVGGGGPSQALLGQRVEGTADGFLVEVHCRLAVGFLVGGVLKRVQRQGVVVGRGDFFFDEATEDTGFDGREVESHSHMIHEGLSAAFGAMWTTRSLPPECVSASARRSLS